MKELLGEKPERDFMTINNVIIIGRLVIACTLMITCFSGCRKDDEDDAIPYLPFSDVYINLSNPEYFSLQHAGSYVYLNGEGVKGIILYRAGANEFRAFERNCSFTPNEACATVEVEGTGLRLVDPCCGSVFDFDGEPISGPAWRPLRQYRAEMGGTEVVISDEIIAGP